MEDRQPISGRVPLFRLRSVPVRARRGRHPKGFRRSLPPHSARSADTLPVNPVTVTLSVSRRHYKYENRGPASVSANTDSGDGLYAEVAFHIEEMIGQAMDHERSVR